MKHIVVYGYYNNNNLGDESFKKAFIHLFPDVNFTFINQIDPKTINNYDCIWFGGGDLFDQKIKNIEHIKIPIGLIGIGFNSIHKDNKYLFENAKIIITRNNSPYYVADDLCFSLPKIENTNVSSDSKIVTIFLNDFVTPRKNAPEWIYIPYTWFISEFSTICDQLHKDGYSLNFVPMCTNKTIDDRKIAASLISKIEKRWQTEWILEPLKDADHLNEHISKSCFIVTQRLHGSVFAYLNNISQISLNHHDKMHHFCNKIKLESSINYYGFNKEIFYKYFPKTYYNEDRETYLNNARNKWKDLSYIVMEKFSL